MNTVFGALLTAAMTLPALADDRLLDDFTRADQRAAIGTAWQGFTDRVMGGRSDMQAGFVEQDGARFLRMRGTVRLDNNGGFVQVRLPLSVDGRPFDAADAERVVLEVRGAPGPYYLHLRTVDTRRPWAYYRAPLAVTRDWQTVEVPLDAFERVSTRAPLDLRQLLSIGLVAYGEAFEAELDVRRLALRGPADSADTRTAGDR